MNISISNIPNKEYAITKKIEALFEDRRIEDFFIQLNIDRNQLPILKNNLAEIQRIVYKLDNVGESNWHPSLHTIGKIWDELKIKLNEIGIPKSALYQILNIMKEYISFEANMRSGIIPTEVDIKKFYTYKICDVQLQRDIILCLYHPLVNKSILDGWKIYDTLCEICDDIDDIDEDFNNYNCNRLLISCAIHTTSYTIAEYSKFITNLKDELHSISRQCTGVTEALLMRDLLKWYTYRYESCYIALNNLTIDTRNYKLPEKIDTVSKQINKQILQILKDKT